MDGFLRRPFDSVFNRLCLSQQMIRDAIAPTGVAPGAWLFR
jgi:hypothetical protein